MARVDFPVTQAEVAIGESVSTVPRERRTIEAEDRSGETTNRLPSSRIPKHRDVIDSA